MIATGLTFLLGVLLTALLVLLVAPAVWRKAQTLARRDYEATIPASANEIRAEFDTVRAAAALTVRQHELLSAEAREKTARAQAQLGRSTVENVAILKRNRTLLELAEERAAEIARLGAALGAREEENQKLAKTLAATRREAELSGQELAALAARFEDLGEIAEERKIQLVAAEAKLDRLADAQRVAERFAREQQAAVERLKGEIAGFEQGSARDKAALAQLNERIAALLAGIADRDTEIARLSLTGQERPALSPVPAAIAPIEAVAAGSAARQEDERAAVQTASQRLRSALARSADTSVAPEAQRAEIRDRISDIAARVIRSATVAEGPSSTLGKILATPDEGTDGAGAAGTDGAPSLAERVRRMAEAEPGGKRAKPARAQTAGSRRE